MVEEEDSSLSPISFPGSSTLSVPPSSGGEVLSLQSSSGARVRFSQEEEGWYAATPQGRLPVHSQAQEGVGSYLSWLSGQEDSVVRSRVHVIPSSASPTGVASVYLGRLGLMGGMGRPSTASAFTSAPVWLASSREKQLHDVVTVAPGKQVRVPYVIASGWRCISYQLHVVQEVLNASHHVEPLQANFSYSRSDLAGSDHHHALNQGLSGPSVSIPTLSTEADLRIGRHAQQAQGDHHYTTNSTHTTHDVLVLVASVPSDFKKKSWRGYKTKPVTTPLKVRMEVILERVGDISTSHPSYLPASHTSPSPIPSPRVSPSPSVPLHSTHTSTPHASPVPAPAPSPIRSSAAMPNPGVTADSNSSELAALLERKLQDPDVALSDAESIGLLTHCVQLGEANAFKIEGKDAVIVLGNTGAGKSTFVNYLLGCDLMKKSPRDLGMKGVGKVVVVRSKAEGGCMDEVMPIGHTRVSKTFVPQIQVDFSDNQLVYCDCPGFLDNRGAEINIANAVNIRRLLQSSRCVKVLALINYHSLKADRGRGIREMLQICTQLFGSVSQLAHHKDSLLLGITQVPPDEADLEGIREWLLEDSPAVMASLCTHLFLYDPLDSGSGDYKVRGACISSLTELKSISQRESSKLFHTVLTDSDERRLLEIVEKQGKQLREHLRSQRYGQSASVWRNLNRLRVIDHISVERMLNDDSLKIQRMLSRRIAKFRDDSVHYRFAAAKSQLSSLREIARHFSPDDLSLLELDVEDLSRHLLYFEKRKVREEEQEKVLHQLSNRLDSIARERAFLEERLRSQEEASSKEQSRLRAEMVRRDGDHEAQVSKIREEQTELLRKQAEASELQRATSEEEREQQRQERERMRKEYEERLRVAEADRKTVRSEYEAMLKAQEESKKSSSTALRKKLARLYIAQQEASEARSRVLPEEAFGAKAWKDYFGVKVDDEPALPSNIEDILNVKAPFKLDNETTPQRIRDNHVLFLVPSRVNGKSYSLTKLGELVKRYFSSNKEGYRYYDSTVRSQFGGKTPSKSYWCLLTRTVLSGSRSKNYSDQKALLSQYSRQGYGLPSGLEASTGIMVHYARSRERLYGDAPWTYTRCAAEELVGGKRPLLVGGFGASGLFVARNVLSDGSSYGVAGCWKL